MTMKTEQRNFIGYEYKKLSADIEKISFLLDGYESFGWEQDTYVVDKNPSVNKDKKTILLKRDRKIMNKMELTRLQRNFEACVNEIDALEKAKTSRATIYALVIGILGTAFMACSVFAITAQTPNILLCIIFAIPGFVGWVLPYFVYKKEVRKQEEKLIPLIEEKYDEIYEICKKGTKIQE
ncbi:MAG TPA: hypothetical protein IAC62_04220 [Candidatus Pelethocola excrementipullorum]|nr:hypothetical protein [Candidatus Pelethocola excrementipullorum]